MSNFFFKKQLLISKCSTVSDSDAYKLSLDQPTPGHNHLEPERFREQAGEFSREWGVTKSLALNLSSITHLPSSTGHISYLL